MNPQELLYAPTHEWAKIEGDTVTVGITQFAQEQLGDLTFVELPRPGDQAVAGKEIGSVESVKAASGEVTEVNTALEDTPELVNQAPFGAGWMFKIRLAGSVPALLDAAAYAARCASEAH